MALISHYRLDGNATDSISGHDGNVSNVSWVDGKLGGAGSFNGSNSRITHSSVPFNNKTFTISAWAKTSDATRQGIVSISYGIVLSMASTDGTMRIRLDNGSEIRNWVTTGVNYADNKFHHYVMTFDGSYVSLYIDGVRELHHIAENNNRYTNGFTIGRDVNAVAGGADWGGLIDDVRIYDHAISLKEVKNLYQGLLVHYSFNDFQEPTENLTPNIHGRPTLMNPAGTTPPSSILVSDETNPFGTEAWEVTFPVNTDTTYWGSRVQDSNWPVIHDGRKYSMSVWIMGDIAGIGIYHTGGHALPALSPTGVTYGKWVEYRRENASLDGGGTTNTYLTIYAINSNASGKTIRVIASQVEQKPYSTIFTNTIREGVVRDSSSQGNDAPLQVETTPSWIDDVPIGGGGYKFDGSQYIVNDIGYYSGDRSYSLWIRLADVIHGVDIIVQDTMGASPTGMQIHLSDVYAQGEIFFSTRATDSTYVRASSAILEKGIWYHCAFTLTSEVLTAYINGTNIGSLDGAFDDVYTGLLSLGARNGGSNATQCDISDIRIFNTVLSGADVENIYQQRGSLDNRGNLYAPAFRESGRDNNVLGYESWEAGTGSTVGFQHISGEAKNHRIDGNDPHGKETVIWEARADSVSGPDGGWNTTQYSIDNNKTYRFTCWIRRNVIGNGSTYIGPRAYGTTDGVEALGTNTVRTNPYFWAGAVSTTEWILYVGHVHPSDYTGPIHDDSGRWRMDGSLYGNTNGDFRWLDGTTTAIHRTYLFYSTNDTTRQQFVYPRMELVDGSEPSLTELINGFDSRKLLKDFTTPTRIERKAHTGMLSEVGPMDNIAAWYPLIVDTEDMIDNNDGTNNGATVTSEGHYFDGSTWIVLPEPVVSLSPNLFTISFTIIPEATGYLVSPNSAGVDHSITYDASNERVILRITESADINNRSIASEVGSVPLGVKSHITAQIDNLTIKLYVNGVVVAEREETISIAAWANAWHLGQRANGTFRYTGTMGDLRIYNSILSPEKVAILYQMTGGSNSMMKQTRDTMYIQGQFKEI